MNRILLAFAIPAALLAQVPKNRAPYANEQWVRLFNGADLTNWVPVGHEKWTVEDGTIHGQGVTKEYGYLRTEKPYKDFWLSIRFKCERDGNSGVYFHTEFKPDSVEIAGLLSAATADIAEAFKLFEHHKDFTSHCSNIRQTEKRADSRYNAAVRLLFKEETNPIEVIKWMSLYEELENSIDRCKDVAEALEAVLVKNK